MTVNRPTVRSFAPRDVRNSADSDCSRRDSPDQSAAADLSRDLLVDAPQPRLRAVDGSIRDDLLVSGGSQALFHTVRGVGYLEIEVSSLS